MTVELLKFKQNRIAKMKGQSVVDKQVVVQAEMLFSRFH
jgi:3-hydroxyacyl-[acyl-carrier-protein] dehydratase